jgi:uncharacterized membrane protein YqjE
VSRTRGGPGTRTMFEGAEKTELRPRIPPPGEVISLFAEAVGHRAQLAQLELGEARDHVLWSGLIAAAAGVMGLLTGMALTLLFAALVWESEHRIAWMVGLCAAYALLAAGAGFLLFRRLRQWRPMAETKFQLDQDGDTFARLVRDFRGQ